MRSAAASSPASSSNECGDRSRRPSAAGFRDGASSPNGCGQRASLRSARCELAMIEKTPQLRPGRVFGRAKERDTAKGAAGVRPRGATETLVAQPPAQEAGHEGVARQNVEDAPPESLADNSAFETGPARTGRKRRSPARRASGRWSRWRFARMALERVDPPSPPAAIMTSSSVPTIRSQSANTALSRVDTASDFT